MKWEVLQTKEFTDWKRSLPEKIADRVDLRLLRVSDYGHFGDCKRFDGITEFRWKNGMRLYAVELAPRLVLLIGGSKNGQKKDIAKAKRLKTRFIEMETE